MSITSPAVTLPARAYTDPVIFERERRELFARSWTPVCSTAQVAGPGDYVSTSIGGEPVIVLRGVPLYFPPHSSSAAALDDRKKRTPIRWT